VKDVRIPGLTLLRIAIGVFFIAQAATKMAWFGDTSELAGRFARYLDGAGPLGRAYLDTIAIPGTAVFARLVPLGEFSGGLALVFGFRVRLASLLLLFMALNFLFASGALSTLGFFTNGYGLPVLGALAALAVGSTGLPWRRRKGTVA